MCWSCLKPMANLLNCMFCGFQSNRIGAPYSRDTDALIDLYPKFDPTGLVSSFRTAFESHILFHCTLIKFTLTTFKPLSVGMLPLL
jgi:hypothetical protein